MHSLTHSLTQTLIGSLNRSLKVFHDFSSFFAAAALNLESPAPLCPSRPHGGPEPPLRLRPRLFILSPLITASFIGRPKRHHPTPPPTPRPSSPPPKPPSMWLINHVYARSCFGCNTVSSSSLRGKLHGGNVFNHCVLSGGDEEEDDDDDDALSLFVFYHSTAWRI